MPAATQAQGVLKELLSIVAQHLRDQAVTDRTRLAQSTDSLTYMEIIIAIEDHFHVFLADDDAEDWWEMPLEDLAQLIAKKPAGI
jgi:acyl carrier protein